jgi:hypothetical protein
MLASQCEWTLSNASVEAREKLSKSQFQEIELRARASESERKALDSTAVITPVKKKQRIAATKVNASKKLAFLSPDVTGADKENDVAVEDGEFDFRKLSRRAPLPGAEPHALAPKPARTALDFFRAHLCTLKEKSDSARADLSSVPEAPESVVLEAMFAALGADERRQFVAKAARDAKRFAVAQAKWKESVNKKA